MQYNCPIKVLQVTIGDGSFGGVANFLYTYYSHMNHNAVHFDFLYCGENSMQSKENDAVLKGSKITTLHILKRNNNGFIEYKKLLKTLKSYFKENQYDVVHVNSSNLFLNVCIAFALKGRAKLISHSHNTKATIDYSSKWKKIVKSAVRKPCTGFIIKKADALFACSNVAGLFLFGPKGINSEKFSIIHNAIDLSKYEFNPKTRERVRKGENRMIVGHVGRLTDQKNPLFILDVFNELHEMIPESVLWMIGEGELIEEVETKISDLHLQDSVMLLGRRDDVAELMQAMDVFLLPSLYEGLSIVTIEAQAAGLPVIASANISKEHGITDLLQFVSLKEPAKKWACKISESSNKKRTDRIEELTAAGYEIRDASKALERLYSTIIS